MALAASGAADTAVAASGPSSPQGGKMVARVSTTGAPDSLPVCPAPQETHATAQQVPPPALLGAIAVDGAQQLGAEASAADAEGSAQRVATAGQHVAELLHRGHDPAKLQTLARRCASENKKCELCIVLSKRFCVEL